MFNPSILSLLIEGGSLSISGFQQKKASTEVKAFSTPIGTHIEPKDTRRFVIN